jgi:hypothetical protein
MQVRRVRLDTVIGVAATLDTRPLQSGFNEAAMNSPRKEWLNGNTERVNEFETGVMGI